MADDAVVAERGVLTASMRAWDLAARRASVIRELAAQRVVSLENADEAAAQLGVPGGRSTRWSAAGGLARDLSRTCCLALPAEAAAAGGCRMR